MLNKGFCFLLFVLGWLMCRPACSALFKAEEFTLDNGLRCVVVENHKAPIVKSMLWYKAGTVDEENGKGGSAHLLEHLMFRGTRRVSADKFNRLMEENGIESNAFTTYDTTVYHEFADVSRLELVLALEADRMQNLAFDDEAFAAEQKIVFQERKERVENNPTGAFYERLRRVFWNDSPYARPISGQNKEILALTPDDLRNFYVRYYAPNNAILVLSGDIDVETIKPLVEKYFAQLPAKPVQMTEIAPVDAPFKALLEMDLPDVTAARLEQDYLLPAETDIENENYAFLILAEYLGGGETSALYRNLVLDKKIALSVSAEYNFLARSNRTFSFNIVPAEQTRAAADEVLQLLETSMQEEMKKFDAQKLAQIKRKIMSSLVYVNDNPSLAANWIGYMLISGYSLDEVQNYAENIEAVSVEQVQQAFERLTAAPRVNGILLPPANKQEENNEQI